jgi:hypothetical protein
MAIFVVLFSWSGILSLFQMIRGFALPVKLVTGNTQNRVLYVTSSRGLY